VSSVRKGTLSASLNRNSRFAGFRAACICLAAIKDHAKIPLLSKLAQRHQRTFCVFNGFWTGLGDPRVQASCSAVQVRRPPELAALARPQPVAR
jgi:hypothetical protein